MECSRFVLLDECPGNAESWFLARCFGLLLAEGVRWVVSFADPVLRRTASGTLVMPGHVGTIYAATNALYTGRATARTVKLLPDGTVFHDRTAQKIRRQEQGHEYAAAQLIALGAPRPRPGCDPARWLREALAAVGARNVRHRGAHRWVFRLGRTGASGRTSSSASPRSGPTPSAPTPSTRRHERLTNTDARLARLTRHTAQSLAPWSSVMPSHPATPSAPDLTSYDLLAPQLSGGKDSAVMTAVFMDAARAAGVDDRVISYHSSLGVLEWPPVVFDGVRYPGVSELAALQSAAFGVPADRHVGVTRTMPGPDGTRMPHSLLTEIAAYGRFPRMGSPYCRKAAKEGVVSSTWTPMVSRLTRELGRPVRILKVLGLRSDE
ncbi:hypothetical protein [Streptomyces sp. NPDC018947]|uniref:Mom family adenine methylcarbamoylation protein n=1 Tax=Streptomyces sp. NPDC018947 TaxID=3365054 RepID=UPI0037B69E6B